MGGQLTVQLLLKSEAERECIRRWRSLPRDQRTNYDQAAAYAKALLDEIDFPTSGDRYHFVRGWLQRDLQLRGTL